MKRLIILSLLLIATFSVFADSEKGDGHERHRSDPFEAEYQMFLNEHRDTAVGDLTFGEMEEYMARLSIPMQEAAYVRSVSSASRMISGMGQFKVGDPLSGTLFLVADLAVIAGTAVGTYLLLPDELQFDQLDYFNTPPAQIKETWKTQAEAATLATAWPTLAVMAGGSILHKIISGWSSKHAAGLAKDQIESGEVKFEPKASFMISPHGKMGFGMGFKF